MNTFFILYGSYWYFWFVIFVVTVHRLYLAYTHIQVAREHWTGVPCIHMGCYLCCCYCYSRWFRYVIRPAVHTAATAFFSSAEHQINLIKLKYLIILSLSLSFFGFVFFVWLRLSNRRYMKNHHLIAVECIAGDEFSIWVGILINRNDNVFVLSFFFCVRFIFVGAIHYAIYCPSTLLFIPKKVNSNFWRKEMYFRRG